MFFLCSSAIKVSAQTLYPYEVKHKKIWGYEDSKGKMIIPAQYKKAGRFNEGFAYVQNDKEKYAFIDSKGDKITKFKYDFAVDFKNGLARVRIGDYKTGKWGLIDKTGKEIIPLKYDYVSGYHEDLILVQVNGKTGFIDITGKEIIPLKYDGASEFKEGLANVRVGDKETGKWGFIDKTGKEIIPLKYDGASEFKEGLAKVRLGDKGTGKWGFIDKTGKEIVSPKYDKEPFGFSEGLAYVVLNGKYGYIDKTGKEIILPQYDDASDFSEGLAYVKLNGKYGYIDKTGKEIIPFIYDEAGSFSWGTARVTIKGDKFEIDKTGRSEEQEKKIAKEKEDKQQLLILQTRTDTTAKKVLDLYTNEYYLLFQKVNELNEYLKVSMPNTNEYMNYQWTSIALEMQKYIKNAQEQLNSCKAQTKTFALKEGENELYDKITGQLIKFSGYITACDVWADFISNRPGDAKEIDKQMERLEVSLIAMAQGHDSIRSFIITYKKRNKL